MPTRTVSTGAGAPSADYPSLAAWWAAVPATLTGDEIVQLRWASATNEFRTGGSFTGKNFNGFRVIVEPFAGEGYRDRANKLTTPDRYSAAYGACIRDSGTARGLSFTGNTAQRVTIRGMQIQVADGYPWDAQAIYLDGTSDTIIEDCIIADDGHSYGAQAMIGIVPSGNLGPIIIRNCVFQRAPYTLDPNPDTTDVIRCITGAGSEEIHVISCTVVQGATNLVRTRGFNINRAHRLHNNVVTGFATDVSASGTVVAVSHNATDKSAGTTGFGATNRQVDLVPSTHFESTTFATFDARTRATATKLIDQGPSGFAPTFDHLGQIRAGAAPDIGAYEYPSAPVAPVITALTVTDSTPLVGQLITFAWTYTGTGSTSWSLDLDGVGGANYTGTTETSVVAEYLAGGTFTATLTVVNAAGSDTETLTNIIVTVPDGTDFDMGLGASGVEGSLTGGTDASDVANLGRLVARFGRGFRPFPRSR
jgi:PKD repeat protein